MGQLASFRPRKAGSGLSSGSGTHLLPQSLKCSADGVDARSLPGIGQQPPGLLDGFDLRASWICIDPGSFPGGLLEAERD